MHMIDVAAWYRRMPAVVAIAPGLILVPVSLSAQTNGDESGGVGTVAGSLMLSTDYRFRGISNSNKEPQVQGDVNWSHEIGVYTGVWASNTNFGGTGNSMELDPYVGFAGSIGDTAWSYDVGYWAYTYPGSGQDFEFGEAYAIGTYSLGRLSISPSIWYTGNYFGEDFLDGVSGLAYDATLSWQLAEDLVVSGRIGEQSFGSGGEGLDYRYYDAGVTKTLGGFDIDLRWQDTDDLAPALADPALGEGELVLSVTRGF